MKLLSYKMLCAMDAADWAAAGSIMAEHFCVPGIAEFTSGFSPAISRLALNDTLKCAMIVVHLNKRYCWYNTTGFSCPEDYTSRYRFYPAFDIWVRS